MGGEGRGLSRQGLDRKRLQNQWQLRCEINASNGQRRRGLRAIYGEDDGDMDGAQLSARKTEGGWGPSVSHSVGSSASEREREGDPGGLNGLRLLLGSIPGAGPF